jgi:hypothetical protein
MRSRKQRSQRASSTRGLEKESTFRKRPAQQAHGTSATSIVRACPLLQTLQPGPPSWLDHQTWSRLPYAKDNTQGRVACRVTSGLAVIWAQRRHDRLFIILRAEPECLELNIVQWFLGKRPRSDWNSWWSLIITPPLLIAMAFSVSSVRRDSGVASRQNTAEGIVTAYEPSNHNHCRYSFRFDGRTFEGIDSSPTNTATVGQHVTVFFDPNRPETNSLEDFESAKGREVGMIPFCGIGIGAVVGFVLYSKSRHSKRADYGRN